MNDTISKASVCEILADIYPTDGEKVVAVKEIDKAYEAIQQLPPAQPTLYGYKIEHLAYIAKVMEKEGVTADYAVRTFDDMSRVIKMIIDEIQQKVEEAVNG